MILKSTIRALCVSAALAAGAAGAAQAQSTPKPATPKPAASNPAAPDPAVPMVQRTEKLKLQGRRGESLLRPGYAVGEYTGSAKAVGKSVKALGSYSKDSMKASFSVAAPDWSAPVEGSCEGGQGRIGLGWITFDHDDLLYVCTYSQGGAPLKAAMSLALSKGSFLGNLSQPQRAGEMQYQGITLRAQTKRLGGLPFGGAGRGGVMGYVITRDGVEVGGVDFNGLAPVFYLPPKSAPDRDAVAVFALTLFNFQDPGRNL
ncbi:hypothetical protein [Caulobacter sp. CCG-8]|uniref:hypothetical protein n=1 Tax=Caulobacter sp. CCG-8 TaxID=3127958 RepID=UPI00307D8A9B